MKTYKLGQLGNADWNVGDAPVFDRERKPRIRGQKGWDAKPTKDLELKAGTVVSVLKSHPWVYGDPNAKFPIFKKKKKK
jgi:hypothetical protein